MMETLESRAEAAFGRAISDWALSAGHNLAYVKFTGAKGWPDRIVTWGTPDGPAHTIWIEWKRKGEQPRPLQTHIHTMLRGMGHDVRVYDDWGLALDEVKAEVESTLRADARMQAHNERARKAVLASGQRQDEYGTEIIPSP